MSTFAGSKAQSNQEDWVYLRCSAVASALSAGKKGRRFESTDTDHFLICYRQTCRSSSDNFATSQALTILRIENETLPYRVTAKRATPRHEKSPSLR